MDQQADQTELERSSGGARAAVALALALALVACALLWAKFGAQVFLDAALAAWKSCF